MCETRGSRPYTCVIRSISDQITGVNITEPLHVCTHMCICTIHVILLASWLASLFELPHYATVCCSVLQQYVSVCNSVLQCVGSRRGSRRCLSCLMICRIHDLAFELPSYLWNFWLASLHMRDLIYLRSDHWSEYNRALTCMHTHVYMYYTCHFGVLTCVWSDPRQIRSLSECNRALTHMHIHVIMSDVFRPRIGKSYLIRHEFLFYWIFSGLVQQKQGSLIWV